MNARQRKKAANGRSPRLIERILGMPRGSCLDAVSFRDDKPRSYCGTRFVPVASPVTTISDPTPIAIDMEHASFQKAPVYLDCDGDGKQHLVEGYSDENGLRWYRIDGGEWFWWPPSERSGKKE